MNHLVLTALLLFALSACQSAPPREEPAPAPPAREEAPGASVDGSIFGGELGSFGSFEAAKPAPATAQRVHRRVLGGGEAGAQTVVLLHGGPGLSHDYMVRFAEHIASAAVRVVLYDQRGAGRSPAVAASEQTLAGQLADLEALRAALGEERLVVIGHSWGGIVAMAYAGAHADRVSKLMLVDTLPPTAEGNVSAQRRFRERLMQLRDAGVIPAKVEGPTSSDCERRILEIMPVYFHDVNHPDTKHLGGASCNDEVLRATWANLGVFDLGPTVRQVRARTWVVAGASDPFGFASSEESAAALAHVTPTVRSLEGCGHIPWEECPAGFYEVVAELLAAR